MPAANRMLDPPAQGPPGGLTPTRALLVKLAGLALGAALVVGTTAMVAFGISLAIS